MMNLHLHKNDFAFLIRRAAEHSGISADIIEKDYYVTLMLEELAGKQDTIKAYFKGGTCLYKIYAPKYNRNILKSFATAFNAKVLSTK